jgi:RNA 3'-terminal phosphate cyclase-like protein
MDTDLSCDIIRAVSIPVMKHFGLGSLDTLGIATPAPEFKIVKRGAPPLGGGEIFFKCPIVKTLLPINLCDPGMFRRVRGLAYSTRCSPSLAQRMATSAKGMFMNFIADIHVYTDHAKARTSGPSAGFAVGLAAESTTGVVLSAQRTAMTATALSEMSEAAQKGSAAETEEYEPGTAADATLIIPEDVGRVCGKALLEEIADGGCVDSAHQPMFCLLMALGPENISRVRFGKLTTHTIQTLRLLREFFGITFRLQPDPKTKTVVLSCLGIGFKNMNRRVC